jgi:hypothetical protein
MITEKSRIILKEKRKNEKVVRNIKLIVNESYILRKITQELSLL